MAARSGRAPRHRREGRASLGPAATVLRGTARGVTVVGLAVVAAAGGAGGSGGGGGAGSERAVAAERGVTGPGGPQRTAASTSPVPSSSPAPSSSPVPSSGGAADAEGLRLGAQARAQAQRVATESLLLARAALQAADGVDALRIAPAPRPGLADLDDAVTTLRDASARLGGAVAVAHPVPTGRPAGPSAQVSGPDGAPGTASASGPDGDPAPTAGTAGERVAVAADVRAAAADVFRLSFAVERAGPAPGPVAVTDGLTALEAAAADAGRRAEAFARAAAPGAGSPSAASGPLRADGTLDPALLCPVPFAEGARLRCDAVDALVALDAEFRAEHGSSLPVGDTYRTYAAQVSVRQAKGSLAAPPGRSHHGWGVAVDFRGFGGVGRFDSPLYRWMAEHGPEHGWVHPEAMGPGGSGPQEPWHWEFVGTAAG